MKKTSKFQKMKQKEIGTKAKISDRGSGKGSTRYSNLKQSLKNEGKLSGSDSRDSKRSTMNLMNPSEIKLMFETQIANREYQLVNALINQAENKQVNNWEEIIRRLNKVLRVDLEYKKNGSRIVKTHLLISNALLGTTNFDKFNYYFLIFNRNWRF